MSSNPESEPKIIVDEDWKTQVEREREQLRQQSDSPAQEKQQAAPRLPPASFIGLISSLASQAAAALADAFEPPDDDEKDPQRLDPALAVELARHVIDTLGVLEAKTRGNLTAEEDAMMQQVLHELRMAFLEVQKRRPS